MGLGTTNQSSLFQHSKAMLLLNLFMTSAPVFSLQQKIPFQVCSIVHQFDVMFSGKLRGRNLQLQSGKLQTAGFKAADDFSAEAALDPIGFDHDER